MAAKSVIRPAPDFAVLKAAFRLKVARQQRRSDGTISLGGQRYEIPSQYRTLERLTVRYARWDMSFVHLVDARTGRDLARIFPIDKVKNADGKRRSISPAMEKSKPIQEGMPPLLRQLITDYEATGAKPAYV